MESTSNTSPAAPASAFLATSPLSCAYKFGAFKAGNKFFAAVKEDRQTKFIGRFDSKQEAIDELRRKFKCPTRQFHMGSY